MTPFMQRVIALTAGGQEGVSSPVTRPSAPKSVSTATDGQVAIRSLAEQLVCEANAVLTGEERISLTDEAVNGRLGFNLRYRMRYVRVETYFAEGRALSRFLVDASVMAGPRELRGPEELENLILLLLGDPDKLAGHPGISVSPSTGKDTVRACGIES